MKKKSLLLAALCIGFVLIGCDENVSSQHYTSSESSSNESSSLMEKDSVSSSSSSPEEIEEPVVVFVDQYLTYQLSSDKTYYTVVTCNDKKVTAITIPNIIGIIPVKEIGENAFYRCTRLESIELPNTITSIGDSAFESCSALANITIPNSVISIGKMVFFECSSLEYNVYENGYYLGNSENPYLVLVKLTGAYKIEYFVIKENTKFVVYPGFSGHDSLVSVSIPNSVISIEDGVFDRCTSLSYNEYGSGYYLGNTENKYLVLIKGTSNTIISCTITNGTRFIYKSAFNSYNSLQSITIPDSVTSIGSLAFGYCTALTSITIPDSVTRIGESAFTGCQSLASIILGKGVKYIGYEAFAYNLNSLKCVYYKGSPADWDNITIPDFDYKRNKLTSAARYYYSETQPTDSSYKYWHYVNNEPTIW